MHHSKKLAKIISAALKRPDMEYFLTGSQVHAPILYRTGIFATTGIYSYSILVYLRKRLVIHRYDRARGYCLKQIHITRRRLATIGGNGSLSVWKRSVFCSGKTVYNKLAFIPGVKHSGVVTCPYNIVLLTHYDSVRYRFISRLLVPATEATAGLTALPMNVIAAFWSPGNSFRAFSTPSHAVMSLK